MEIDGPRPTVQGGTSCAELPARTKGVRNVDFQKCAFRLHGANIPPLQVHYSASLWNDCASVRSLHDPLRMTDHVLEPVDDRSCAACKAFVHPAKRRPCGSWPAVPKC